MDVWRQISREIQYLEEKAQLPTLSLVKLTVCQLVLC